MPRHYTLMDLPLLFKAALLGVVEGLTEFLPISSTGHLIVAMDLLDFTGERAKVFAIVIQLAAILAVCWDYRGKIGTVLTGLGRSTEANRFVTLVFVGFLPAAVLGLLFHSTIKTLLFSPFTVAAALVVGGLLILWIERLSHSHDVQSVEAMSLRQALQVGLAQSVAMFPGVSRSGATIMGGLLSGLSRRTATEFSFFLAIPTMVAATALDLYKARDLLQLADVPVFAVGFIASFFAAMVAVRGLLRFVSNHDFVPFAWYRIAFGLLVLASWQFGWVDWNAAHQ